MSLRPAAVCRTPRSRTVILSLVLTACAAGTARAGSVHGFGQAAGNCANVWRLPDTGQTVHYSTATGDDSDHSPAAIQPSYTDNLNGTITDNVTGLIWKKCSEGQNNDASCSGPAATYGWGGMSGALAQCESLTFAGASDWRLPNIKELMSIVDYGTSAVVKINGSYFQNTQASNYWSSTYNVLTSSYRWMLDFSKGVVSNGWNSDSYYVRCVRGGL